MAPDLDAVQTQEVSSQNIQLVGPSMGTGSGVEVPIPIAGPSTLTKASRASPSPGPSGTSRLDQPPPSISITRASAPAPLLLPTQSDIVPPTAERGFAADDVEAGMGMGMDSREAVPLREMTREDSIDSVTSERTAVGPTSTGSKATTPTTPVGLGINPPPVSKFGQDASVIVAEPLPSLMDSLGTPGEAADDPITLTPTPVSPVAPSLVSVPTFEGAETASVDEKEDDAETDGEAPPTTIRLVGGKGMVAGTTEPAAPAKVRANGTSTPQHVDSDNDSRTSLDLSKEEREERKKKRFSKGLAKLGLKGGKRKEDLAV